MTDRGMVAAVARKSALRYADLCYTSAEGGALLGRRGHHGRSPMPNILENFCWDAPELCRVANQHWVALIGVVILMLIMFSMGHHPKSHG
jgi:hypothetical protein